MLLGQTRSDLNSSSEPANGNESSPTQRDMNEDAFTLHRKAEEAMAVTYNNLIEKLSSEPTPARSEQLRKAQRAWIAFRDAHLGAIYPPDMHFSALPMCEAGIITGLTEARTKQLNTFLQPKQPSASDATANLKRVDEEMAAVYGKVMQRYSTGSDANPALVVAIRKAQRAWIAFRNAHIESLYSAEEAATNSQGAASEGVELTKTRISQLREWSDGIEPGDIGAGTPQKPLSLSRKQNRHRSGSYPYRNTVAFAKFDGCAKSTGSN